MNKYDLSPYIDEMYQFLMFLLNKHIDDDDVRGLVIDIVDILIGRLIEERGVIDG